MYSRDSQGDVVSIDPHRQAELALEVQCQARRHLTAFNAAQRGVRSGGGSVYVETSSGKVGRDRCSERQLRWQLTVRSPGTGLETPGRSRLLQRRRLRRRSGNEKARGHLDAFDAGTGSGCGEPCSSAPRGDAPRVGPVSR